MAQYTTYQQHEPLRVPDGWNAGEKKLIAQLEEILDDLYRRFNRLKLTDLSKSLRTTIINTEDSVTQLVIDVGEISSTVATKNRTYAQDEAPTEGMVEGDLWIDTNDSNKLYRYSGEDWVEYATAGGAQTFAQAEAPTEGMTAGDLWIDTNSENALYRYSGSAWEDYTAVTGANTYSSDEPPTTGLRNGDLWVDTSDNNNLYRYSDGAWVSVRDSYLDGRVSACETNIAQNTTDILLRATKTEMSAAIDGVPVGGENLFLNTSSAYYTATADDNTAQALANVSAVVLSSYGLTAGQKITYAVTLNPTVGDWALGLLVTNNGTERFVIGPRYVRQGYTVRSVQTYTIQNGDTSVKPAVRNYSQTVGGTCRYASPKLERGASATPYSRSIANMEASINVNASNISSKVSKNNVISEINQSAEAVTINANKLNLTGYVTVASLGSGGTTTIDGGRITTGTVAASRIDVDNLYVKHLNGAEGTFSSITSNSGYLQIGSLEFQTESDPYGDVATTLLSSRDLFIAARASEGLFLGNADANNNIASPLVVYQNLPYVVDSTYTLIPKIIRGTTYVSADSAGYIDYSSAGFRSLPVVLCTWAMTGGNSSGNWGAPKVYAKSTYGAYVIAGGSYPSSTQPLDWIAVGW